MTLPAYLDADYDSMWRDFAGRMVFLALVFAAWPMAAVVLWRERT